jgi:hypothetical protein
MSSAIKYYNTHKEQVLLYKRNFYINKNNKYIFFKNIKLKGISKRESKRLIKDAIDKNVLNIFLNQEQIDFNDFINNYEIKDYSILEVDSYLKQYIPEEGHLYYEAVEYAGDCLKWLHLDNLNIDLYFYDNQIIKI